jgi:hypothetical protein
MQLEIDHKRFLGVWRSHVSLRKAEVAEIHTNGKNLAFSSTDQPLEKGHGASGERTMLAKYKANKTPDSKGENEDESDGETSQANLESMIQLLHEDAQHEAAKAKFAKHNRLVNDSANDGMAEDTDEFYQQAILGTTSQHGLVTFKN